MAKLFSAQCKPRFSATNSNQKDPIYKTSKPTRNPPTQSTADIKESSVSHRHGEIDAMSEKSGMLSLVTCTSCGKPIPPGSESTKFLCPSCGEIQIKRDGKCRKFGRHYKCPKCGFTGP